MKKQVVKTLVFSGGGVKGISYIGVYKKLEELHKDGVIELDIKTVAGVSIGALVSFAYAMGYNAKELEDIVLELDLDKLRDVRIKYLFSKWGLESGKKLMETFESLLEKKGHSKDATFEALYEKTGIDFHVYVCNLSKYKLCLFSKDNFPKMPVVKAVRMSIGIPFVFTLQKYNGDIHVDGGIMNNYPIQMYDKNPNELDNVLGVKLISLGECDDHSVDEKINNLYSYAYNVMSCVLIQKDRAISMSERYKQHTIHLDTKDITHMIDVNLSKEQRKQLIMYGYNATETYFRD